MGLFGGLKKKIKRKLNGNMDSEYIWELRAKAKSSPSPFRYYYRYKYTRYQIRFNAFFPIGAEVKSMPVFPHGLNGIFISAGARIGEGCIIFQQVTIGSNTLKDSKGNGAPSIGDNVYIGAGAKIIGNVKVGNNVRIGANCVVVKDVPDNTTVVPAETRYIERTEIMDNSFFAYDKNKDSSR